MLKFLVCVQVSKEMLGIFSYFLKFSFSSLIISSFNEGDNLFRNTHFSRKLKKIIYRFFSFEERVIEGDIWYFEVLYKENKQQQCSTI